MPEKFARAHVLCQGLLRDEFQCVLLKAGAYASARRFPWNLWWLDRNAVDELPGIGHKYYFFTE